jgi:hypothetical protein
VRSASSLITVAFWVFCSRLPGDENPPAGPVRPRAAHWDLGPVDPKHYAVRLGIGQDIGQGVQPQPGLAWDSKSAGRY